MVVWNKVDLKNGNKTINNQPPLQSIPKEVIFKDIEIEYTYEIALCIRTFSIRPKRVRFIKPKTKEFRCFFN